MARSFGATAQAEGWERVYGEAYSPHFPGMLKSKQSRRNSPTSAVALALRHDSRLDLPHPLPRRMASSVRFAQHTRAPVGRLRRPRDGSACMAKPTRLTFLGCRSPNKAAETHPLPQWPWPFDTTAVLTFHARSQDEWRVAFASLSILALRSGDCVDCLSAGSFSRNGWGNRGRCFREAGSGLRRGSAGG